MTAVVVPTRPFRLSVPKLDTPQQLNRQPNIARPASSSSVSLHPSLHSSPHSSLLHRRLLSSLVARRVHPSCVFRSRRRRRAYAPVVNTARDNGLKRSQSAVRHGSCMTATISSPDIERSLLDSKPRGCLEENHRVLTQWFARSSRSASARATPRRAPMAATTQ